ncbi:MurT ligase domain-containing protein [Bifidobacterium aquikefiricola]|uniref:Lipid II isoglutaminyl synthase (glutamine-hydrolyzing) subunit MurT n=1 Tax=Bifidobacterium aquikefiricola TaxID=3059038 RepID=A0AB39U7L8_9BIFI
MTSAIGKDRSAKPWYSRMIPLLGKSIRALSRLTRHGGSAFPGKVIEACDPDFLARTLAQLPDGVVLVSGTNGKTTTTRMVSSILETLGMRVFTNPTGSNFTRGVVSALLDKVDMKGNIDADIAVLELDEAYAVHFVHQVQPRYALLLNVMRDQLDRFGEIDNTARMLGEVAKRTTGTVVLNREDPRIAALAQLVPEGTQCAYFGLAPAMRSYFPDDDSMHDDSMHDNTMHDDISGNGSAEPSGKGSAHSPVSQLEVPPSDATETTSDGQQSSQPQLPADVTLNGLVDHGAIFDVSGTILSTTVKLEGVYNLFNAAAALTLVGRIIKASSFAGQGKTIDTQSMVTALSHVTPAFGRGEIIDFHGTPVELVLVKNPMGFRLALASFTPAGHDTMIVINDEFADGRDMSWLWDVDFSTLRKTGVAVVSGVRAWDMALRLDYDQVHVGATETNPSTALEAFLAVNPSHPKRIFCTYTAMLKIRTLISHLTEVADAGL